MSIFLFQAGETEVFTCTLAAKQGMWLGRAIPPRSPAPRHPPAGATTVPIGLSPNPPPRCLQLPVGVAGIGGGGSPGRVPSPQPPAHPALPCLEAAQLSLLTLPFGSCSFGLTAALILVIPWKESFSITQLAAKPSACQLCLLTRVPGVPQQHTPAPAQPGLPVPAFCTPKPHSRLPSPLGTFHPGTPEFRCATAGVGTLAWQPWPGCTAAPAAFTSSGAIVHSTSVLFTLQTPCVCDSS